MQYIIKCIIYEYCESFTPNKNLKDMFVSYRLKSYKLKGENNESNSF